MNRFITPITLVTLVVLSGCGFAHDEHLVGPYRLIAVDAEEQMSVCYGLGDDNAIGRINETVFAVGWDDRYLVAKQHPQGNRNVTHYFYLAIARDGRYVNPRDCVTGPLSETEFDARKAELGLPGFTRVIRSLE